MRIIIERLQNFDTPSSEASLVLPYTLSGELVSGPEVVSRGFVFVKEAEELIFDARNTAYETLMRCYDKNIRDWGAIKGRIRDDISRLMYERTRRSPMILPILMEI